MTARRSTTTDFPPVSVRASGRGAAGAAGPGGADLQRVLAEAAGLATTSEAALALAAAGLAVFPCRPNKKPGTEHGFYDATTKPDVVRRWWKGQPSAAIGLPTGSANRIAVVDCDVRPNKDGLRELEHFVGALPNTFSVSTPSGGRHFYFECSGLTVKSSNCRLAPGVDVRGAGGYVIAPPSVTAGGRYTIRSNSPLAPCPDWLVSAPPGESETTEKSEAICSVVSAISDISDSAAALLRKCLPRCEGERNRRVLDLARALKFDAGLNAPTSAQLKPMVREWHRLALPVIGTKAFDETWADFLHAYDRARHPLAGDAIGLALEKAKSGNLPREADRFDSADTRLLVGLCWHLSRDSAGRFFLSSHTAAKAIGIPQAQVFRRLRMLCVEGIIGVVEIGNEHKATRYVWAGETVLPGNGAQ